jgi:hypothetical protein
MKRKSFSLPVAIALACLVTAGCDKPQTETPTDAPSDSTQTPVWEDTITIRISFGDDNRTRASLDDVKMKDLWLYDYVGGSLVQSVHQSSADDGFGSASVGISYGEHTFYVVASGGSDATIDETTITWGKPGDTFYLAKTVDLQPTGDKNVSLQLKRVATRLRIDPSDEIPADIASLAWEGTWYFGFNYLTGEAEGAQSTERSVSVPASYIGTTGQLSVASYSLCPIDGYTTDIKITARRSDESAITEINLSDVTFERNRLTILSGGLATSTRSFGISVDDAWADDYSIGW